MIPEEQGRLIAEKLLQSSQDPREPELAIDWNGARIKEGILIAPYNSAEFLRTGKNQLLDCWPILVNLSSGEARFGELEERDFWKTP